MRNRPAQSEPTTGLSGKDRGAIEEFLVYIEDRVEGVEPVCAELVRMARLVLAETDTLQGPERVLH